jgi:cold shock CspA family protein
MGNRTGMMMDKEKMSVTGTIKSMDKSKDMMVVTPEGGGTDMSFKVKSHDAKKFKDGEKVTVMYEMKGGEMVAKRIMMAK